MERKETERVLRKEGLKEVERKVAERVKDGAEDTREHAGCATRWDTNRVRRVVQGREVLEVWKRWLLG